MKKVFAVATAIALLSLDGIAQANIAIDTVTIGDKGNAADASGYGSVGYYFNIGKYEVTAGQYAAFLNAKANVSDNYGLYNTYMANTLYGSGITRNGYSGSYSYTVDAAFVNRPVNFVGYWDALRFTNWLNNGQGDSDTETGAYTLNGYNANDGRTIQRNANWKWAITSEDEWYKAAYYDPNKQGGAGYWLYPTKSNAAPGRDLADVSGNNANYWGNTYPIQSPYYTTVVGEFQNSASAYGTFDQGGNVWEWNEAIVFPDSSLVNRGLRGGASGRSIDYMQSSYRYFSYLGWEDNYYGFRVVQAVPEPSSIVALLGGLTGLMGLRRRKA